VDIVIHNYRWRLSLAQGEPQYDAVDRQLAGMPPITVPAITIASDFDGPATDGSAYRQLAIASSVDSAAPSAQADWKSSSPKAFRTASTVAS
jgi:hypothetical protein